MLVGEQMGEDQRGGAGVVERVVGAIVDDAVALGDVAEPMGEFTVGVEPTGELQRAQASGWSQWYPGAAGGTGEKGPVEVEVVGDERRTIDALSQIAQHDG